MASVQPLEFLQSGVVILTERVMDTSQLDCQNEEEEADVVRAEEAQEPGINIEWLDLVDPCKSSNLTCGICEKTFSSSNYLQYHINYVHSENKVFTCEHCMKNFKAPNHLKLHIKRLHNKNNQYFCNKCTANFGLQYDMKVHMKTHVKDQQFMCELCDKTLANKRGLEEHRRTHTYERPYMCKAAGCGLRFGQKKTLRVHMR